jgi:hypothetical protein
MFRDVRLFLFQYALGGYDGGGQLPTVESLDTQVHMQSTIIILLTDCVVLDVYVKAMHASCMHTHAYESCLYRKCESHFRELYVLCVFTYVHSHECVCVRARGYVHKHTHTFAWLAVCVRLLIGTQEHVYCRAKKKNVQHVQMPMHSCFLLHIHTLAYACVLK